KFKSRLNQPRRLRRKTSTMRSLRRIRWRRNRPMTTFLVRQQLPWDGGILQRVPRLFEPWKLCLGRLPLPQVCRRQFRVLLSSRIALLERPSIPTSMRCCFLEKDLG
ncbi:unnamed protein product, partial [Notodromas monacha]